MAVKKATAKKSVAKKVSVKKAAPKRAMSKATTVKKVAKKSTVKKSVAKKATTKPLKKSPSKKAAAKATTRKKATTKKAATKKSVAKKSTETIVIPEAPILASRNARVEIVSTPMAAAPAPILTPTVPASVPNAQSQKPGASNRVIFAVVVGIILLGLIVWAKGHNSNSASKATTTPTATSTPTPSVTPTPTPSDTTETLTAHEAPQGVVAHYTSTGATVFWKAPTALQGLSGYNVEISVSNGPWKLISTVPATQLSLDVTKENGNGWTSFKVSSVYTDSETIAAKAFGLPGTYS